MVTTGTHNGARLPLVHSLLLVHSPLLGPSSLARLRAEAARAGRHVMLPDLTATAGSSDPHDTYIRLAVEAGSALRGETLIVGHSGAGVFLPLIAAELGGPASLVFVDAVVPPRSEPHQTPDRLAALLDEQSVDGVLRPWLDWWPPGVIDQLLSNPADQAKLRADIPQLPRSFYDRDVPMPAGWSDQRCGYMQLSAAYNAERTEAESRGWPTTKLDESHLAVHTAPGDTLEAILGIADALKR